MLVEFFEQRRLRWAVLSGVMAGGALATKYTGLQLLMLLVLLVLAQHLAARRRSLPTAAFAIAATTVLLACPFLWRNWMLTGWPLFPFPLGPLPLDPRINWDGERAAMFLTMLASYGSGAVPAGPASLQDALLAPVRVFLQARFDDHRLYDGVVGPVFLLTPLALWRFKHDVASRTLALFSLVFVLVWGLTIRQARFLIPVLPIISVLLVQGLNAWRSRIAYAVVWMFVLVSTATAITHTLDSQPVAFWRGAESRESVHWTPLCGLRDLSGRQPASRTGPSTLSGQHAQLRLLPRARLAR